MLKLELKQKLKRALPLVALFPVGTTLEWHITVLSQIAIESAQAFSLSRKGFIANISVGRGVVARERTFFFTFC